MSTLSFAGRMPFSEIWRTDPGLEIHPSETLDALRSAVTSNSSLDFSGGAVLYATKLSGSLLGVPITLTPGNVITVLLKLLNSLTPLVPVTMTDVTTDDFLVASDSLQANQLTITAR